MPSFDNETDIFSLTSPGIPDSGTILAPTEGSTYTIWGNPGVSNYSNYINCYGPANKPDPTLALQQEIETLHSKIIQIREHEAGVRKLLLAAIRSAGDEGLRITQKALFSIAPNDIIKGPQYDPNT